MAASRWCVDRKTRTDVTKAVRDLEDKRKKGGAANAGQRWSVATWLAPPGREHRGPQCGGNPIDGYRVAVHHHLILSLGARRLEKLEPEHLARPCTKMQDADGAPGTAH
ncbi:hypothetical protein [Kitasatospora sp. McL0602]|uniref:hypothetical protein n=1 Tax=Kitasatospora sp. McL0602 TaxID=3439530 RepID=UPI003F8CE485